MQILNSLMQVTNMINVFTVLIFFPVLALGTIYQHTAPEFSVDYNDAAWELKPIETKANQAAVDKSMAEKTLVNLQRRQADDKYHSRFSVVIDEAKRFAEPGKPLLDSYRKHAVEFLESQRFSVKPAQAIKLPGVAAPAIEIIGEQRDFGLTFRQIVFLDGDQAVLVTGATRKDKYDAQAKELQGLFDSFKWAKK